MDIQDFYQKHLANSMHKRFNDLNYIERLTVKKAYDKHQFSQGVKSIKSFMFKNMITIITFLIAVLTISYGVAIQILKTLNPDA